MTDDIDTARCPLCGADNGCAMASGSDEPCWCMSTPIDPAALAAVPAALSRKACICAACAKQEKDGHVTRDD